METIMRRSLVAAVTTALIALPVFAALPNGTKAPDFTAQAALAGKDFTFNLADALKQGPVVLYFFPKVFTSGCTAEAHDFAEATEKFKALGATVIGFSHDPIDKVTEFSTKECRDKFAVGSDADGSIMKKYDSVMLGHTDYADRTSYVIAPTGEIIYSYTAMNPDKHVENTMAAVQKWHDAHTKS
jgi:thioredoxin-dependent peroxiredoxin